MVKRGANWNGNGSKRRHEAQGVGTSGRGWQAAVADDIQVGGASHRERRWGAGKNREGFKGKRLRMGRR